MCIAGYCPNGSFNGANDGIFQMDDCKPMQEILDGVLIAIATSESHLKTLKADCRQTKMEADEVCRFLQVLRSFESATKGLTLAQIVW